MILPDANLLLYAYDTLAGQHARARQWWEDTLSSNETVGLSWQTVTAFIRIGTNARAFTRPLLAAEALAAVDAWVAQPCVRIVTPGPRHWTILRRLISENQIVGPLVMDAHLAALAIEFGAIVYSADRDFLRFSGLKVQNPLGVARTA